MFGIGMPEMLLILAIALIVIGPKKLPDLAKTLGRAMGEFKKATNEMKQSITMTDDFKEVKSSFDDLQKDIKSSVSFDNIDAYQPSSSKVSDNLTSASSSDDSSQASADTSPPAEDVHPKEAGNIDSAASVTDEPETEAEPKIEDAATDERG